MKVLVTIALLATLAGADDPVGVCAHSCALGGSASMYEAGMQYHYQYQGEVSSTATAGQEESRLALTAEVFIIADSPCDLKLQVMDLVFEDTNDDDAKWLSEAVQEHDLHFSYQHGVVTHLCPHDEEEAIATNFKRGILSALQMSVSPKGDQSDVVVSEVDVTGQCDTKYSLVLEPSLEVTKTKIGCHTSSYIPHLPHSHYTNTKANTELPFAKSNRTCHMQGSVAAEVRGDIDAENGGGSPWQKVECREVVEVQRPLTPGSDALASVTLSSTLTLQDGPSPMNGNFSKGDEIKRKVSLVADIKAAVEFAKMKKLQASGVKDQVDSALKSLSDMKSSEGDELKPRIFSNFINLLGHVDEEEVEALWDSTRSQKAKRKVLLDGLLVCDATPCHGLVARLASEQGQLTPGQVNMWLAGLHLHTSAHPSLVTQLLDLTKSKKIAPTAVMAASSVVNRLCHQQPEECASVSQPFLEFVTEEIGESCGLGKTKQQQEHINLILRAVGNAGVMPSQNFPERCYMNRALPPELRITALQSYRRVGCGGTSTKAPWKLLEDSTERSEVRIAAYLALVPCAAHSSGFFTRIHKLLQQEELQQVYSFIWTHIKNLMEQPGPGQHDQTLSKLARQHSLPHKFNNDAFRASGHYRYSAFSELLNLGGSLDASVVYSQDSYLPRQASANLTLDLLDNSFNFLDFGGQFSGIENIIEGYFGKEGYFSNEDILKVLQSLRPKRNIIHDDKIQEFQKMYDEEKNKRDDEGDEMEEEEAKTSFYVRMFGNEVFYAENILQNSPAQLLYQLIQEISSPKISKIIDQEYMAPTFLGFPLWLKLNATASVSIQHEHTFSNNPQTGLLLKGTLTPSVVAAMDETLVVDAFVSSSGLRRSSTQLAKITIGGELSFDDGEVAELQVSVPDEEVAKVSSTVTLAVLQSDGSWKELEEASAVKETDCFDTLEETVGLKTCTSLSHNTYEVDGQRVTLEPYKSEYKLTRTDTFKYYKLYIKQQDGIVEALFDTPGSSVDRKLHFLFNISPNRESGDIIVRGVGYDIMGKYRNTQAERSLQLQSRKASEVLGELQVSLKKQREGSSVEYVPAFLLVVGSHNITLGGKLQHDTEKETKEIKASWKMEGAWRKKESAAVTQGFGSAAGNFSWGPEETRFLLTTVYGTDPSQPHNISLSFGNVHTLERNMKTTSGYAGIEIGQLSTSLMLQYEMWPDLFDLSINTSFYDTQVVSEVVLKDQTEGGDQDSQLTLSLASPQLNLDYKASGIYKVSENGFQAEAELNLGSSLKSKVLFTYLFEDDPLHLLTGLHFSLDDFVYQVGYTVDMSQPDSILISASGTVGEGKAGLNLQADYGHGRPFSALFEVSAGLGMHSVGLASHTTSDTHWHNFTGKSTVKWFEWSGSLAHEVVFNDTTKAIKLSLEDTGSVELFLETWPDRELKVVVRSAPEDSSPVFMVEAERHVSSEEYVIQVNVTSGDRQLVHLAWNMESKNEFALGLHLLESQLDVTGQYNVMENGTISGASLVKIMLPSGDSVLANLSLNYVMEENEHLLMISGNHEESVIESQLAVRFGGSQGTEPAGVNFTLKTPHPSFQKFGFDFHRSSGPGSLYSAEIQLDEFKILGEAQLSIPSNLLLKLELDIGDECTSSLHLQHSHSKQNYLSVASLALTQASKPWELVLNTSLDHSSQRQFLDLELDFQAPVMPDPFHFHGLYNVTEDEVHLEMQADLGESISVVYQGKKEFSWKRHLLHGLCKVEASWMESLAVNLTYDHTVGGININVDFQDDGDYISSWTTEFSSEYSSLEDIKASFYLTHPELQITIQLAHNQSQNSYKQQLDGSINTFTISYNTNVKWNEYLIPTTAEGSLSLFNFFDHSLDLSLSHLEESSTHKTQVTGTFDNYNIALDHQLSLKLANDNGWQDSLLLVLRDIGATTGGISLTTNAYVDWPSVNASLEFESPWTDSFSVESLVQEINMTTSFKIDAFHKKESLFSGQAVFDGWPTYDSSDIELKVMAVFMDELNLKLHHNFNSGNLIFGDIVYGSDLYIQLGSHLIMKKTWYGQDFVSYSFNATTTLKELNVDFKSKAFVDSLFNATLEGHWNENFLSVNSSVPSGKILEVEFMNPEKKYFSELTYEVGDDVLFTLDFTVLRDGESLVLFRTVVLSAHPKLDAIVTLKLYADTDSEKYGKLVVTADLSKLKKYSFQARLELESTLFFSKKYGGKLDLDFSFLSDLNWKAVSGITLHGGEWNIRGDFNSSLEVSQGLDFEFGAGYHLVHSNKTFDLKDMNVVVSAKSGSAYEVRVILQPDHTGPPWSLAVIYNPRFSTLKGFLSLAAHGKYELSLRFSTKTLTMDLHQVNEDESKWQIVEGNINWIIKPEKQLVILNMKSDIPALSKITGKVIVQKKRDLAVIVRLKVNDDEFKGNFRLSTPVPRKSFRLDVKVDNSIVQPFESEVTVECSFDQSGFSFSMKVDLNQVNDWIKGSVKFSVPESYLKLKTPFSFLESFNATIRTKAGEEFAVETFIEAPDFCFNVTASISDFIDHGSLYIALVAPCGSDCLFNFHVQFNITENPISASCELNIRPYGSLFRFNTTGNLSLKGIDLKIETEAYPHFTFGLELMYLVEQYNLKLLAYDPPSNETYFTFETLLSHSKAELTFVLSEEQSLLFRANYDFQNQPLKLNSSFSSSLFGHNVTAEMAGKATFQSEEGTVEVGFSSNTIFSYLNVSTTYSFSEELKEINFKILTPKGDTNGGIIVLKAKDFYSLEADMTSGLHTFDKYNLKVRLDTEDDVEKLEATLGQGEHEYRLTGSRNITEKTLEAHLNVSLPFQGYEHINLYYIQPNDYSEDRYLARITLKYQDEMYVMEAEHDPGNSLYQLGFNQTNSVGEYVYTLSYSAYSSRHRINVVLNGPELEGNPLTLLLKYHHGSLVSAMFYSPHGQLGAELAWSGTGNLIVCSGTADLTLFDLGEFYVDMNIPLVASEKFEMKVVCVIPDMEMEMWLHSGDYFRTGSIGLTLKEREHHKDYSLAYDFKDSLVLKGQFDQWNLNTTLVLKGRPHSASSGTFEVRSNLVGYEIIDGMWNVGQRNWEYFCVASLEVKHQEVLSVSATLNTLSEGAYRPWQNVHLNMLLESPFTLPHHLHAEYQTSSPKLLLYYQHGLDTFKTQLDTFFGRNRATLALTGNIPVRGISTFDINLTYSFENAFSTSVVMKIEDSTLEHRFDFSPDWRVGSIQVALTSPFLRPGKVQFSWALVPNSINLKGFFNLGEHSGKMKISLKNTRSSADFECHITSSMEELSQFIVNLSYKMSGNNNFDASLAAKLNNNGALMKSSLDTKGGKLLLRFQGTFEILGNRGSLDVDVGPSGDGYSGSAVGQLPGYKKFSAVLYVDSFQLNVKALYDSQELLVVSITYSKAKVSFFWTEYWSFTLTAEHASKDRKHLLTMMFAGFGIKPIELEANYSWKRNHQIKLSLNSSLLPPLTLQILYSGNKVTVRATVEDKTYDMTGRAAFRNLKSSFNVRFESSESPDDPIILQAEYDLTDFFRGRMKAAMELAQITLDWGGKVQVNVTGQRRGEMAKIDLKVETPLEVLPHLHTGFHGEFFLNDEFVGFNCTALVEWSERVEVTAFAKLTPVNVNVECILLTSFSSLEKLSASFKFEPGQVQLTAQHNSDTWKAVWEYQFVPFSITCLLETPIENLEKISLSISGEADDEEVRAQFALSWAKDQRLGIDIVAKMWQVKVHFQTPWESLTEGTLTASLKTEGEELTLSSILQLDNHEAEVSFILLSTNFEFSVTYSENLITVGSAKLEYLQRHDNLKISLQIQTPYEGFKLLESSLKYSGNKISLIFIINESVNSLEGVFSLDGGELMVNVPIFNNFSLSLKSETAWLKAETNVTFNVAETSEPLMASLSYNFEPQSYPFRLTFKVILDEELMSVDVKANDELFVMGRFMKNILEVHVGASSAGIKLEAPDLGLESVEIEAAFESEGYPYRFGFTLSVLVKQFDAEPFLCKIRGTYAIEESQTQSTLKIIITDMPTYRVVIRTLPDALGFQILIKGDDTELFSMLYSSGSRTDVFLPQKFVFQVPLWGVEGQALLTYTSLAASLTLPQPSGVHTLTVLWPEKLSLQELEISAEFQSSYIPQDVLQLAISFKLPESSKGKIEFALVSGDKGVRAHGDYHYDEELQTFTAEFQLMSDWFGDYSLQTSAQWRRNIVVSAILQTLGEKHSLNLFLDAINSAIELKLSSPWLPAREITFTGEMRSPLNLSHMVLSSKLQADDEEVQFEAQFKRPQIKQVNSYVVLRRNRWDIFSLSLEMFEDDARTDFDLSINFLLEDLKNIIHVRYYDAEWGRYFSGTLDSHMLAETVQLKVINSHIPSKLQSIEISGPDFQLLIESHVMENTFIVKTKLGYDKIELYVSSDLFERKEFGIRFITTFISCESLILRAGWSEPGRTEIRGEYSGNGEAVTLSGEVMADDLFGYSISTVLITSFEGYQRFALFTPQYKSGKHSKALLEYPGRKVGLEMNLNYQNIIDSDFVISLYLPYENFEIISVKYIMDVPNHFEIEARTGKIGLTLLLLTESLENGILLNSIVGINEYRGKSVLFSSWILPKRARARYTYEFEPRELVVQHSFHGEVLCDVSDRIFFTARDNTQDWVTVHTAWGADKIFTLVTPKFFPGYVHVNLESSTSRDDYRLELGLLTADAGSWTVYGMQLHQEMLPGGRFIALMGNYGEHSASFEGTLSINSCHFNNSLIFSLNENRLGYKTLLLSEPHLLSRTFTSDIQLLLHNKTLLYHTYATASPISLDLISYFTWNKMDISMPPIKFRLSYDDDTFFFISGTKYLNAVLSHPDILQDIRLQANMTRTLNSSLYGSAELVDDNSPEMKVVAALEAEPVRQDGRQTVSLSFSQPASNLSVLMEVQLQESAPLSEAQCHLKYYSLASEEWHRLNLSASLETEGDSHAVTVTAAAPERGWGRTWRGAVDSQPEEVSVLVEGSSDGPGDAWRLGTVVRRRLPELHVYLSVGREQEVHQEARLRLGLHSPVEAGVALDHFSFGQWHRDTAAAGLRLTSPHILQAFMEFDPSLNYEDPYDWAYLFSPTAEVVDIWSRDADTAAQSLKQWAVTEAPAALDVLFSKETIGAVWQREASNWDYFLKDVEDSYQGIVADVTVLWDSVLLPVLNAVKDNLERIYTEALTHLADLKENVQHSFKAAGLWLWDTWSSLKTQAVLQEAVVGELVSEGSVKLGQYASTFWTDLLQRVTLFGEQVTTCVTTFLEESKSYFIMLGQTIGGVLSSTFQAIQPSFEGLSQAFQSYGSEVVAEFSGPCWMALTAKGNSLASLVQGIDGGMIVVIEFLQIEKFSAFALEAGGWLQEKMSAVWSSIEAAMTKANESLPQVLASWTPSLSESFSHVWDTLTGLVDQVSAGEIYPLVVSMTGDLQEKITHLPMLLKESIEPMYDYLIQFSAFKSLDGAVRGIYEWGETAWENWSSGKHISSVSFPEKLVFLLADAVQGYLTSTNYLLDYLYVAEPTMLGYIHYNQYLPAHWNSFLELPHWNFPSSLFQRKSAASEAKQLMAAAYPNPSLVKALLPFHTATAVIAGQHVITFDLQHYQFLGSCSYLLAKDFEGGDFEVFGEYESESGATRLKSVVVHGPNVDVTLSPDGSVTSRRLSSAEIHNSTEHSALKMPDLFLSCDRALRGCSLTVSSRYFGRLGGLLGNYNGEASDDLRGPGEQVVHSAAQLATQWAISPTPCYQANQAHTVKDYSDIEEAGVRECSQLFLYGNSPFSDCFQAVDPHPYFTHCIEGYTHPAFTKQDLNAPCTAVAAYRSQCWARKRHLPNLDKCQNGSTTGCTVEGKEVPYGWSQVYEEASHGSADVAVIVELAECNAGKDMTSLLDHLARQLGRKNINDVRYAVVAAGESETITKSFLSKRKAETFLSSLTFNESISTEDIEAVVAGTASAIEWRPGVSRSIVHVGCQVCARGDPTTRALHQNDVTYHLVSSLELEMSGTKEMAQARIRKLFGFDENLVYVPGDFKVFQGSEKLRLALRGPKGGCVTAALSTGGSVFDSSKWNPRKAIQTNKFLSVLGERVAVSSSPPKCQECQCLKGDPRMTPVCFKCFGNSVFFVTHTDTVVEDLAKDTSSVTQDIKRNFQEVFLERNNSTMLRII